MDELVGDKVLLSFNDEHALSPTHLPTKSSHFNKCETYLQCLQHLKHHMILDVRENILLFC